MPMTGDDDEQTSYHELKSWPKMIVGSITRNVKEAFSRCNSRTWDDHSFFILLQSCIDQKSLLGGKQVHSFIITSGSFGNKFVVNLLLNMYSKIGDLQAASKLFDVMPRRNVMSCNIIINGYLRVGDTENANRVFAEMPERNVATWNAMVAGMTQFEFNEAGLNLFMEMYELGFQPDNYTLGSVMKGCAGLRNICAGKQVHAYIMKSGFEFCIVVGSSLAHMYMKSGSLKEGEEIIKSMPTHNLIAWNTLIAGKAQNGQPEEVLSLYSVMKIAGFRPNKITLVSVLSSCSDLATIGQGQQIHAETIKAGCSAVTAVISSLVSMYSKCGYLEDSVKAFSENEHVDVVLWSSIISAYGFHGRGEEAIRLFERKGLEDLEANDVTFLCLLYACCHSGMKDKGMEIFELMKKNGAKPRVQHYTCVVDLIGRAGCLDEAEALIRSMPVKADTIIWKTLLSACKIHKNADMAKRIAEEVLGLHPQDSASYVLLSNIHASAKSWHGVSAVRIAMRDMKVKKEPGISWLEIKNQVHQFCTADKSHPKSKEIDLYLEELMQEMKLRGYVPDTASVLHDMDNEEKEYNLARHSEKLAVAFALMYTSSGVPIRIMKNLRVCSDCHVAFKYISQIRNREIIVRDNSRFHHFKDGKCSCGDYW